MECEKDLNMLEKNTTGWNFLTCLKERQKRKQFNRINPDGTVTTPDGVDVTSELYSKVGLLLLNVVDDDKGLAVRTLFNRRSEFSAYSMSSIQFNLVGVCSIDMS